jgi:hypothetical protein
MYSFQAFINPVKRVCRNIKLCLVLVPRKRHIATLTLHGPSTMSFVWHIYLDLVECRLLKYLIRNACMQHHVCSTRRLCFPCKHCFNMKYSKLRTGIRQHWTRVLMASKENFQYIRGLKIRCMMGRTKIKISSSFPSCITHLSPLQWAPYAVNSIKVVMRKPHNFDLDLSAKSIIIMRLFMHTC